MASVSVLGSGSWGTALAIHLARLGKEVTLWARNANVASLRTAGEHTACHPGFPFPESLTLRTTSNRHAEPMRSWCRARRTR